MDTLKHRVFMGANVSKKLSDCAIELIIECC